MFHVGQTVTLVPLTRNGANKLAKSVGNEWRIVQIADRCVCFGGAPGIMVENLSVLRFPTRWETVDVRWVQSDGNSKDFVIKPL